MEQTRYAVIKDGYVINVVVGEAEAPPTVPQAHDANVKDAEGIVAIGDWYASNEGIFYRPLGTPPDLPEELLP